MSPAARGAGLPVGLLLAAVVQRTGFCFACFDEFPGGAIATRGNDALAHRQPGTRLWLARRVMDSGPATGGIA